MCGFTGPEVALAANHLLRIAPKRAPRQGPSAELGPAEIAGGPAMLEAPAAPLPLRTMALWALLAAIVAIILGLSLRALTTERDERAP